MFIGICILKILTMIMYLYKKKYFKEIKLFFSLADQSLVSLGNFLLILFLTRSLIADDMGAVGYVLTIYLLLSVVNNTSIFQYASFNAYREENLKKYLGFLFIVQAIIIFVTLTLSNLILYFSLKFSNYHAPLNLYLSASFFLVFQQISDFNRRCCYIESKPVSAFLLSATSYLPRIILLFIYEFYDVGMVFYFLGSTAFLSILLNIRRNGLWLSLAGSKSGWLEDIKEHFIKAKWLVFSGPLVWLWGASPNFFVGVFGDIAMVSIFVAVRSIANLGNVLMELIETLFAPSIGKIFAEGGVFIPILSKVISIGFFVWLFFFIVLYFFGEVILSSLYGPGWEENIWVLLLIWVAQFLIFMFRVSFVYQRTIGNSRIVLVSYFLGFISVILFTPILVSAYGVVGAALGLLLGASTIFISQHFYKLYKVR